MKLVVIESPFAASAMHTEAEYAAYRDRAMKHSFSLGEYPFASHRMYPGVLDDNVPEERKLGIEAGLAWGAKADLVAVYCDYGFSKGMRLGIETHKARGTKIVYRYGDLPKGLFVESETLHAELDRGTR